MEEYIISDHNGTEALILPEKGATVVSFKKNGTEYLYRDDDNLLSDERPRCGIPFMFPIFGRLKDGKYTWNGTEYAMPMHGFGHTSIWQVVSHTDDCLVLTLEPNESTRAQYPFLFKVTLTFRIEEGTLTITPKFENHGTEPMPFHYGFHPYFLTRKPEHIQVETTATTRLDFVTGPAPFGHGSVQVSVPAGAPEAGACLLDVQGPTALRNRKEERFLTMDFDKTFNTLVLWTLADKPFLCVEPVNGGADSLNTGNHLTLAPGETREAFVSFRAETN